MKLKNLKLNEISNRDLNNRQMNALKGGGGRYCTCSCYYADSGGSSNTANRDANYSSGDNGYQSTVGDNNYMKYDVHP